MTTFDERKKAEEARHALKEELRFKAASRANKLAGLWAADRMGHADPDAYAAEIVGTAVGGPNKVREKIQADLDAAGQPVSDEQLEARLVEIYLVAEDQVLAEAAAKPPES